MTRGRELTETVGAGGPRPEAERDRPLEVVMVTRRPPEEHGGVERVVRGLIHGMRAARPTWTVQVRSAFSRSGRLEGLDGVSDVLSALRLGWRLRPCTADVLLVHAPECVWGIRLLAKPAWDRRSARRGHPAPALVAVWHGAGRRPHLVLRPEGDPLARLLAGFRSRQERWGLRADRHVVVHSAVRADLGTEYGFDGDSVVIENAIDDEQRARLAGRPPERGDAPLTALWIGQSGHRKGLDVALAAHEIARRENPHLRLLVAGLPPGPPLPGVEWLGVVAPAEVAQVYHRADVLLFPTRYEAHPLVVLEAMTAGLAVIASDAVPAGVVEHGRNGYVITGHDPQDYAAALGTLGADPALRRRLGRASRADAQRFTQSAAVASYIDVVRAAAAARTERSGGRPTGREGVVTRGRILLHRPRRLRPRVRMGGS